VPQTVSPGPVAAAMGTSSALWLCAGVLLTLNLAMLLIPPVWSVRARTPEPAPAVA
jgi:hypothetical protein